MKRFIFLFGIWTGILMLVTAGAVNFADLVPAAWVPKITRWAMNLVVINTFILTQLQGYNPNDPVVKLPDGIKRAFVLALMIGAFLLPDRAFAGDLPTKAFKPVNPFASPYDLTKAGAYFGAGFGGSEGSVNGTNVIPGTQIVQGSIYGTVGYGAPINAATGSFWFAEAQFGIQNLNGNTNGLSLSGPATFTQRFGAGTPLNQMIGTILPGGTSSPAVPTLPVLPAGVTAGPGSPYAFFALHEDDISNQVGLAQNRQWLISYGVGVGLRYRLSNAVVADTFAEYKAASNSICTGPLGAAGCAHIGPGARVGVQFLY